MQNDLKRLTERHSDTDKSRVLLSQHSSLQASCEPVPSPTTSSLHFKAPLSSWKHRYINNFQYHNRYRYCYSIGFDFVIVIIIVTLERLKRRF